LLKNLLFPTQTSLPNEQPEPLAKDPFNFQAEFAGYMEMYSNAQKVAEYLDAHKCWFSHCAQPMKTEPLGENGYTLMIGRFAALGYEVEPKIALVLNSSAEGMYRMETIPVPEYQPSHYEVDYQALMELVEVPIESASLAMTKPFQQKKWSQLPGEITRIDWQLNLKVAVRFPKFIEKLPTSLIQNTGDRLLTQIVRQVSPYLTYRVQQDFHTRFDLPIPPKSSRKLQIISL
jgi:hypothetical protein